MLNISTGQCGTCAYFGGGLEQDQLVQIRVNGQADDDVVAGCDLPSNASVHLRVAPTSSCDGYTPAEAA